ncbi:MAG TPA: RagB/SusD family nutrient uptake outer membrane protein, partial [Puia sp.]|nr:RagB/SusD family nutrient uptake outer membrane protein [Puia sp.]
MKKYLLLLFGVGVILSSSCKKELTETPYSFLTPQTFYKTAADAQSAIDGALSALQPQAYYQR